MKLYLPERLRMLSPHHDPIKYSAHSSDFSEAPDEGVYCRFRFLSQIHRNPRSLKTNRKTPTYGPYIKRRLFFLSSYSFVKIYAESLTSLNLHFCTFLREDVGPYGGVLYQIHPSVCR